MGYKVTVQKLNTLSQSLYTKQKQRKLLSFESFLDNFVCFRHVKWKIFQLIFCGGYLCCLFLLVGIFSLVLVAEFSALSFCLSHRIFFSIITSYKLILLKHTEEDLQHPCCRCTRSTSNINWFIIKKAEFTSQAGVFVL